MSELDSAELSNLCALQHAVALIGRWKLAERSRRVVVCPHAWRFVVVLDSGERGWLRVRGIADELADALIEAATSLLRRDTDAHNAGRPSIFEER